MRLKIFFLILFVILYSCSSNPTDPGKEINCKIIFISDRDSDGLINIEMGTKGDVYSMLIDGSNITRLTNNNRYNAWPLYSSDGEYIVFRSAEDWLLSNIHIINADGSNEIDLGSGDYPKFSHDNSKILYQSGGVIGLMNMDGSDKVLLTDWADSIYSSIGQDYPVQFSSDDSTILFQSRIDNNTDIYTMSIDGTNIQRLTSDAGYDGNCSFSNDDSKILFSSYRSGVSQIYIMDSDGKNKIQLTTTEAYNDNAGFSQDGNKIVFISNRDGTPEIYLMNSDGSNQIRLSYTNSIKDNVLFSPDGNYILYSAKEKNNLNENKYNIYSINIKSGETVNITNDEGNNFVSSFSPILE